MSFRAILPDGKELSFDQPPTILTVAQKIGAGLARATVGGRLNGSSETSDLRTLVPDGAHVEIVTATSAAGLEVIRHSAAHVLAQAVQALFPEVKVTVGPVIEDGFYYDFDSPRGFTPEDLIAIEAKMGEIISANLPITRRDVDAGEATRTFASIGEKYKIELIEDIVRNHQAVDGRVGVYSTGEAWFDLCRGPHVQSTGQIKAIKLLSVAGAYWRGDEKRDRLQRIYGTAFNDKKDLAQHLERIEEAKRRDHRKLGKDLELFAFHPLAPGSPFFTARGSVIYNELIHYLRELYREHGYGEVITPQLFDPELFRTSGHLQFYKENIYTTKTDDGHVAALKPMNCPGHCLLFSTRRHSYRELPVRMADFGRLHRYERSGTMHGISRVRTFCQDDAHIFARPDQLRSEIRAFMELLKTVYNKLGLDEFSVALSTRPAERMGSEAVWDLAEESLAGGLKDLGIPFHLLPGEGAFYGPKIEIQVRDAIGRSWQLGTLQCDFNLPEAFDLSYIGEDNHPHRPVILHRAVLGSLERFLSVYMEHTSGHLPTWLAPVQAKILTVTDQHNAYGEEVRAALASAGVRVEFDDRSEKLGYKIREAQLLKIPYMLVIGDTESSSRTVSVRERTGQNLSALPLNRLVEDLTAEIRSRSLKSSWFRQDTQAAAGETLTNTL